MPRPKTLKSGSPPKGFSIRRDLPVGRHALLEVFPGAGRCPIAAHVEPDPAQREALFRQTEVEIVTADLWMYVAPREVPPDARRGWKPVVSPDSDCIVAGQHHLVSSPTMTVYMDIYHELSHVRQRRDGANLWEPGVSYVKRWTELEAYRIVVEDARARGASDEFLRDYLEVEWISPAEHAELLKALGVAAK